MATESLRRIQLTTIAICLGTACFVMPGCSNGEPGERRATSDEIPQPSAEELVELRAKYEPESPLSSMVEPAEPRQPAFSLRATAADSLARIGAPAVPALIEALGADEAATRLQAARALSRMGPPASDAIPALVRALNDPDVRVRNQAARALGQIGSEAVPAIPALVDVLYEPVETETAIAADSPGAP